MGDSLLDWTASLEWPRMYLAVTAVNLGVLAGAWSTNSGLSEGSELVTAGLVVGPYLSITALYYWHVSARERQQAVTVVDRW